MNLFELLNDEDKRIVNSISARLSLRKPQRESLEILARILELNHPKKNDDLIKALKNIQSEFPEVIDFDREFVSLCFALATGVGKTRLMGAFISLLNSQYKVRNFFILAPNLTIYNKLITDFSPTSAKYVLNGLQEFANNPPRVITGDNYDSGINVSAYPLNKDEITINVFNIAKISRELTKIKSLSEHIGESYFTYLTNLDDLVMIMDESHRYRASAGFKAINELKPLIGIELTATPRIVTSKTSERFKNVVYDYPLANAIADGFTKEPAVATREDFEPKNYKDEELEELKIKDGIRVHEDTKIELETFARNNNFNIVKPFILIVAKDTTHANKIVDLIKRDDFFNGKYKDKVITVHSNQRGEESDENIARLLAVEDPKEPTEIVVHVDKLKEGWDVTNLYTIVPLRAADSSILVEQSIGRGLRLPYGKRVNEVKVDRLTIIAHDRFNAIVAEANKPGSIIRAIVKIGEDISLAGKKSITISNTAISELIGNPNQDKKDSPDFQLAPFEPQIINKNEVNVVKLLSEILRNNERLVTEIPNIESLIQVDQQQKIIDQVTEAYKATSVSRQEELDTLSIEPDIASIVKLSLQKIINLTISIPSITLEPKGLVRSGFNNFDLNTNFVNKPPVTQNILIESLRTSERDLIETLEILLQDSIPENYIVRNLVKFDDISYEDHAELIYKLSSQVVSKIRTYQKDEANVLNIVQFNQKFYAELIHDQMLDHWWQEVDEGYEVVVSKGYQILKDFSYAISGDEKERDVHIPLMIGEKDKIAGMIFGGFKKCSYPKQKFSSDTERAFASMLERDPSIIKWFKPTREQFQIRYRKTCGSTSHYEPDFVVETNDTKYIFEPKQQSLIEDPDVLAKSSAATAWCQNATTHELKHTDSNGKPWVYVLIPHTAITASSTIKGLIQQFKKT
jgi:type III restriction enzyme